MYFLRCINLFRDTDTSKIWHGNEHALDISGENMHEIDPPHGEKIMSSTIGILHAFQFLEDVLLSRRPGSRGRHSRKRYECISKHGEFAQGK